MGTTSPPQSSSKAAAGNAAASEGTPGPSSGGTPPAGAGKHHASILFTAFEPSGDALAAPVIAELRQRVPHMAIYAWGGPKMQEAGATILEMTCDDAAMGLGALSKAMAVRKEIRRIKRWSKQYRVLAHIAVDSPAANFPICKIFRKAGSRVLHLAAPQIWAWGRWRIGKLRRLTDLVMCLLPFEEQWFNDRRVPARFIGHPVINRQMDPNELRDQSRSMPQGAPRVAILPGSRAHEVAANIRLMVNAYTELQSRHSGMSGIIVAANPKLASIVRKKIKTFPMGLHMVTGLLDGALHWCDVALAVSGTVTLDVTRHRKPMVAVYKSGLITWLGANVLVRSSHFVLPNLIAEREIVPEFVPYMGGATPIVNAANKFLVDSKNAANLTEELNRVCLRYSNKKPAEEAARWIVKIIRDGTPDDVPGRASQASPKPKAVG